MCEINDIVITREWFYGFNDFHINIIREYKHSSSSNVARSTEDAVKYVYRFSSDINF